MGLQLGLVWGRAHQTGREGRKRVGCARCSWVLTFGLVGGLDSLRSHAVHVNVLSSCLWGFIVTLWAGIVFPSPVCI